MLASMLRADFLLTKIRKLRIWIETDLSHRRNIKRMNFFHWKSYEVFHEAWNSVTQSSAMWHIHTNGKEIADVLSGKNICSTVDPKYNKLWRGQGILFDIIAVRRWIEKIRKLRFSHFCILFLYCASFTADPLVIALKFWFKSLSYHITAVA